MTSNTNMSHISNCFQQKIVNFPELIFPNLDNLRKTSHTSTNNNPDKKSHRRKSLNDFYSNYLKLGKYGDLDYVTNLLFDIFKYLINTKHLILNNKFDKFSEKFAYIINNSKTIFLRNYELFKLIKEHLNFITGIYWNSLNSNFKDILLDIHYSNNFYRYNIKIFEDMIKSKEISNKSDTNTTSVDLLLNQQINDDTKDDEWEEIKHKKRKDKRKISSNLIKDKESSSADKSNDIKIPDEYKINNFIDKNVIIKLESELKSKQYGFMNEFSDIFIQNLDTYPDYIHDEFISDDEYSDVSDDDDDEGNYLNE